MLSQILFDVPLRFVGGIAAGDVVRYGSILKDAGTGKILGHLQESGLAQSLLSQALSTTPTPLGLISNTINAGASIYTATQVHQIKEMIGVLQGLQVATLGVSLVGLGVSVAGFMYMRKRFNHLDSRLDQLRDVIKEGFENLEKSGLRQQMSRTKSLVQRAELAKSLIDPLKEYREVAAHLADQAAYFEGEIVFQLSGKGSVIHEKFWLLAQLWMLCNSVRIDCLIRANELLNALRLSEKIALEYQGLFERVGPGSFDVDPSSGMNTVTFLRDATDSASSKPFLLDYLRTSRLDGPTYIESLEVEKDRPLLVLTTG
jgi:hypothetical protein